MSVLQNIRGLCKNAKKAGGILVYILTSIYSRQDQDNSSGKGHEMSEPDNVEGLAILYSAVSQDLMLLHDADTAVENKIIGLFAACIVVLTLLLDRTRSWRVLTIIGVVLLGLAIVASLFALLSRPYYANAVKVGDHLEYLDMDSRDLIKQLIADSEYSFGESNELLELKAKIYNWVLVLFILGLIVSLLSFYIKIVGV